MFWKNKEKAAEAIKKAVKDVVGIHANSFGATRRATGMFPLAATGSSHEIAHTSSVRFHQLLISLEGNQRTGCLRIISPRRKARSAILIYRGRVVGCLYGCKKLDFQHLQQDAHKHALADLASPGNILDAYELPEELVLAAASLFNGDVIDINLQQDPKAMFEEAIRAVGTTNLPGCVVLSTLDDEMVCMVYMHAGRVIGVFSAADGWVTPTYEAAMHYLKGTKPTKVMASFMPIPQKASDIGFSLTGLGDAANRRAFNQQQAHAVESFTAIRSESSTYTKLAPVYNQQRANAIYKKGGDSSPVRSGNVFAIAP